MKQFLLHNLAGAVNRRDFVKLGALGLGVLAGSPALGQYPGQVYPYPQPLPPPLPVPPGNGLLFEVGSGVHHHMMLRLVQDYIAQTLSPDFARAIVEARVTPRTPTSFHEQFWSNYTLFAPIMPTRSRYGYWVSVTDFVRGDSRSAIRSHKDWNYFELRRAMTASEISQFGVVVFPCGHRVQPTPADLQNFARVARTLYGIANPQQFQVLYTRPFSDGRRSFTGYFTAYGPDPMRSPYKDLLLDNVPV